MNGCLTGNIAFVLLFVHELENWKQSPLSSTKTFLLHMRSKLLPTLTSSPTLQRKQENDSYMHVFPSIQKLPFATAGRYFRFRTIFFAHVIEKFTSIYNPSAIIIPIKCETWVTWKLMISWVWRFSHRKRFSSTEGKYKYIWVHTMDKYTFPLNGAWPSFTIGRFESSHMHVKQNSYPRQGCGDWILMFILLQQGAYLKQNTQD